MEISQPIRNILTDFACLEVIHDALSGLSKGDFVHEDYGSLVLTKNSPA